MGGYDQPRGGTRRHERVTAWWPRARQTKGDDFGVDRRCGRGGHALQAGEDGFLVAREQMAVPVEHDGDLLWHRPPTRARFRRSEGQSTTDLDSDLGDADLITEQVDAAAPEATARPDADRIAVE